MIIKQLLRRSLILSLILSLAACEAPTINLDRWNPEVAIPILHTSVSIEDFLENSEASEFLSADSLQFLTLIYEDEVFASTAEEFIDIPDFNFIISDTAMVIEAEQFPLDFQLDYLRMKSGELHFRILSQVDENVQLKIEIPNLKKEEIAFVQELMILNTAEPTNVVDGVIDITDYTFNFVDEFNVNYTATTPSGERVVLMGVEYTFRNLLFKYAEGNFDPINFGFEANNFVLDDFVETSIGENFTLEDPTLKFLIKNSVGMPMKARAVKLNAMTESGEFIPFESELTTGISVNYPSFDQIGTAAYTSFTINKENSNIVEIVNAKPTQFEYQLEGTVFPEGGVTTGFALDSSTVEASFVLEVPLWGSVKNMEIEEVADLDTENFDRAKSLELKIVATNAFPIEATIQVYFETADGTVLETLVDDPSQFLVASADVLNGAVIAPVVTELNIPVSADKMAGIISATKIRIAASISTANSGNASVRFFTDYMLDLKVGMKVNL